LFSVEQAFVRRDKIQAPLKMPAWEATCDANSKKIINSLSKSLAAVASQGKVKKNFAHPI